MGPGTGLMQDSANEVLMFPRGSAKTLSGLHHSVNLILPILPSPLLHILLASQSGGFPCLFLLPSLPSPAGVTPQYTSCSPNPSSATASQRTQTDTPSISQIDFILEPFLKGILVTILWKTHLVKAYKIISLSPSCFLGAPTLSPTPFLSLSLEES